MRSEIDMIDASMVELLSRRMSIARDIGVYKKEHAMTILQIERWKQILNQNVQLGEDNGLSPRFIEEVYKAIHQASIPIQRSVLKDESVE